MELRCAGAAAGRTTVSLFIPIQVEYIVAISSGIAMLRSLERSSPSCEDWSEDRGVPACAEPRGAQNHFYVICNQYDTDNHGGEAPVGSPFSPAVIVDEVNTLYI